MSIDKMIQKAKDFETSAQWTDAIGCYETILSDSPRCEEACYRLGLIYQNQNEIIKAIQLFEKLCSMKNADPGLYSRLGSLYAKQNMWEKAESAYRKGVQCDKKYTDAWFGLGQVLTKQKRPEEANAAFHAALYKDPQFEPEKTAPKNLLVHKQVTVSRLRIGFITHWTDAQQSSKTKIIHDMIARDHETFILTRTGGVYCGSPENKAKFWNVPHLTTCPEYKIPAPVVKNWIRDNHPDIIILNNEYDWALVNTLKNTGIPVINYLDYYRESWKPHLHVFDAVICATLRTFHLARRFCRTYYTGWAVDTDLFKPVEQNKATFFHNAGCLGDNYRVMTPAAITAFDAISQQFPEISLFVHVQSRIEKLPLPIVEIIQTNPRITCQAETAPAPGYYQKGQVLLFPSRLEGLGLPLLEGLSCGMPVIATNAPPMNEFVRDGFNGLLVNIGKTIIKHDQITFPETVVDMNDLAIKMAYLARNPREIDRMAANARLYAEDLLSQNRFRKKLNEVLSDIRQ